MAQAIREDHPVGVQSKPFVTTTNSNHALEIYLNQAQRMMLTSIGQLWVAGIRYGHVRTGFVYLAVILVDFSEKVVGWKLDRTLEARLVTEALDLAVAARRPPPGLLHHSDRGIQHTSAE